MVKVCCVALGFFLFAVCRGSPGEGSCLLQAHPGVQSRPAIPPQAHQRVHDDARTPSNINPKSLPIFLGKRDDNDDNCAFHHWHPQWLQECEQIYLDLGSNIGVQVRKLFEAEKYDGAAVLPIFDEVFGAPATRRNTPGLCALGFEPNPMHRERLLKLAEAYNAKGWRTHFYPVAAWDKMGTLSFDRMDKAEHLAWGAHVGMGKNPTEVCAWDTSAFLKELPSGSIKLAKMDIEGAEWVVLPQLLKANQLCSSAVGKVFLEVHSGMMLDKSTWPGDFSFESVRDTVESQASCDATSIVSLDDESFMYDHDSDLP